MGTTGRLSKGSAVPAHNIGACEGRWSMGQLQNGMMTILNSRPFDLCMVMMRIASCSCGVERERVHPFSRHQERNELRSDDRLSVYCSTRSRKACMKTFSSPFVSTGKRSIIFSHISYRGSPRKCSIRCSISSFVSLFSMWHILGMASSGDFFR